MNPNLDLSDLGYKIITEIKRDKKREIITWKGLDIKKDCSVIIKQFCFGTENSSWSGYQSLKQEIKILEKLQYPRIPQYLGSFEDKQSFYLVEEYLSGLPLSEKENLSVEEVKVIAFKILEILVYLQEREEIIVHHNIKPENILIDPDNNISLIDFSCAEIIGNQNIKMLPEKKGDIATIVKRTPGFIAPESTKNPSKASDLYSLGVTLISLLTDKNSSEILDLTTIDRPYKINFLPFLSHIEPSFLNWLNKMVEPEVSLRFPNAEIALNSLKGLLWEQPTTIKTVENELPILSNKALSIATLGMGILGLTIGMGIDLVNQVTDKTIINIGIAIIAAIVIYISQSIGVSTKEEGKTEGTIIATVIPLSLVIVTGFIFGRGEAVVISLSAIVAQTVKLSYVLLQKLPLTKTSNKLKAILLLSAILSGFIWGFYI